jgi:hypothetical protein
MMRLTSTGPHGSVALVLVHHLEVECSIPAASVIFSAGKTILALISSNQPHNIF